jgi:hypothetical protein
MATSQTNPGGDALKPTAPYVPFKSFLTALDRLAHGHSPTIDGSFWHGFSGGLQRQMMATMRFFGLLDETGKVSAELDLLAKSQDRKEQMEALLRASYPSVFDIGLAHATPNQFNDALRQFNVAGSTLEKARSFFLQAAKFCDLQLSPGIQQFSKPGANGRRRKAAAGKARQDVEVDDDSSEDPPAPPAPAQKGSSRTIPLRGGGTATLSFDVDVWSMTPEDQQFVFDMIKRMTEYERSAEPKS